MKNYRVCCFEKANVEKEVSTEYDDLGQAMIWVKHYGHRMAAHCNNATDYCWHIEDKRTNLEEDDFFYAYGGFDILGRPVITDIKTF